MCIRDSNDAALKKYDFASMGRSRIKLNPNALGSGQTGLCKHIKRGDAGGVSLFYLFYRIVEQPSFLPEYQAVQRREKLENTIDSIRSRFGHFSIQPAANLLDTQLSGLNPQAAIDPFTA